MECPDVNVPIGEICKLEDEFKLEVQKLKVKFHPDMATEMDELYNKMVVKIRYTMYRIMFSFPNNPAVNGFVNEVVKKLMIYTNPEENPTNGLPGTRTDDNLDVGLANVEVKVEEVNQESPVLNSVSECRINGSQLQPSTSAQQNDEAIIIPVINQLPQLVGPVLEQNTNNRPLVIEPPVHISKKDMWKKLPLEPATCLVKDCGTKFDYRGFRQDHIDKDHQNTELTCPLCPEHFTTYTTLDRHYQKKQSFSYQCTFASCAFTSKTKRQVTKHFKERHMVSAIVNYLEDKSTNQGSDDGDDDLSKDELNSEENANVGPINQGSTATVPSPVASGRDDSNELPVVQQPSTSTEHKTMKRSIQSGNNEECNQVYEDGQAQSSSSVKKAKLVSTQSNNAQRVDQSRHRCITEHCALSFDNLDDLDQHTQLVHSQRNQLAMSVVESALTTIQFDYGQEVVIKQEEKDETTNNEVKLEIKGVEEEEEKVNETQVNDIDEVAESNQSDYDESRSVENAPMDTTPPHPSGQSQVNIQSRRREKRKQTDEEPQQQVPNEVNIRDIEGHTEDDQVTSRSVKRARPSRPATLSSAKEKKIITVRLRCPQVGCGEIAKHEFNQHLMEKHSIGSFQCAVKDCAKWFTDKHHRRQHLTQSHQHTSQWHCPKCPKYFISYRQLSTHYIDRHQLGHFQCSFPSCTFTGESKKKVYDHYTHQHKDKPELVCPVAGCVYRTKNSTRFKAHEHSHLDNKPYHCKWPDCHYSSASQGYTLDHIKTTHFKSRSKTTSSLDLTQLGKPKDYIELVR